MNAMLSERARNPENKCDLDQRFNSFDMSGVRVKVSHAFYHYFNGRFSSLK